MTLSSNGSAVKIHWFTSGCLVLWFLNGTGSQTRTILVLCRLKNLKCETVHHFIKLELRDSLSFWDTCGFSHKNNFSCWPPHKLSVILCYFLPHPCTDSYTDDTAWKPTHQMKLLKDQSQVELSWYHAVELLPKCITVFSVFQLIILVLWPKILLYHTALSRNLIHSANTTCNSDSFESEQISLSLLIFLLATLLELLR